MEASLILAVTNLIVKHGIPAAVGIMQTWKVDPKNITLDDINALHDMVPRAETYFEEGTDTEA